MRSEAAARSGWRHIRIWGVLAALAILLFSLLALPSRAGAATNSIVTVAGSNSILGGFSGDGGPATAAELSDPSGVAVTPDGGYLIADARNAVVRRVSPTGIIATVAGTGDRGSSGDGGPARAATLTAPLGVAATPDGGYLIADAASERIRKVSASGIITTVGGTGLQGFSGDGGPATMAQLFAPSGVAATADGGFLIADTGNSRVRKVSPTGTITTVAGTGVPGFSGDGGPATAAQLGRNSPYAVAATPDGGFLIADDVNSRVRKVSPTGMISTVAGTGVRGFSGDGGPATAAALDTPSGIAATADGGVLIADMFEHRVRRISPTGTITTVAGTGTPGFSGDGAAATAAQLDEPFGVAATASGGFLIGDSANNRVRFVDAAAQGTPPLPVVGGVSPIRGPVGGGTPITVTGSGFSAGDRVVIGQGNGPGAGAIAATRVSVISPTQITATTGGGARAGTWNLFVIAPNGTTSQAVTGDQFTYAAPPPVVSTVAPHSGPTTGGTPITITGSGFAAGDRVVIGQGNGPGAGAIAATTVSVASPTQITATTGGGARAGAWNLFVIAPDGTTSQAVGGDQFNYTT